MVWRLSFEWRLENSVMGVFSSCMGKIRSDGYEAPGRHGSKISPLQNMVNKIKLMLHKGQVNDAASSDDAAVAPTTTITTATATTAPGAIANEQEVPTHQPTPSVDHGITIHSESQQSRQQVQSLNNVQNGSKPLANDATEAKENNHMVDSSSEKIEDSVEVFPSSDAEDVCSTCLEEYDEENPKITTQCNHHFHLPCIHEWMQKSATCPLCGKESIFPPRSSMNLSSTYLLFLTHKLIICKSR